MFALVLSLIASLFLCSAVTAFADNASSGDDLPPVTIYDYGKDNADENPDNPNGDKPESGCNSSVTTGSVVLVAISVTAAIILIKKRKLS